MAKLADLVLSFSAETADIRKGLDAVQAHMKRAEESAGSMAKAFESVKQAMNFDIAKEAVKALGEFVLKGAELADHLGKMAAAAGAPVEEFSRLAYAARLGGVSN